MQGQYGPYRTSPYSTGPYMDNMALVPMPHVLMALVPIALVPMALVPMALVPIHGQYGPYRTGLCNGQYGPMAAALLARRRSNAHQPDHIDPMGTAEVVSDPQCRIVEQGSVVDRIETKRAQAAE
jgi:hypothetical protein